MGSNERSEEVSPPKLTLEKLEETYYEIKQKFDKVPDYFECNFFTETVLKSLFSQASFRPILEPKNLGDLYFHGIPIEIDELLPNNIIVVAKRPQYKGDSPQVLKIINLGT